MTTKFKGQQFALLYDMQYEGAGPSLGMFSDTEQLFWFDDGDGYSPQNLELTFGNVQFLTLHQLEILLPFAPKLGGWPVIDEQLIDQPKEQK